MTSPSILIVGSMAFDDLELPSGVFLDVVGGAATYAAIAASNFAPSAVVAVVGEDFPADTIAKLEARGIATAGVEHAPGNTFRWRGRYAADLSSRETLDTQLNVFATFQPVVPAELRRCPYLLLGNIHPALQVSVLDQMEGKPFVVADTMNLWIGTEPTILRKLLLRVDLLTINDEEARQLSGYHSLRKAARAILEMGPKQLIIKRGEHGALHFATADDFFYVPAFPLETEIDPTGAGDTFAGALLGTLAAAQGTSPADVRRAMVQAAATASFCVEAVGTNAVATLAPEALADRIAALRAMTAIAAV